MTRALRIGVLGGTLDPVHFGHLDAAVAAREALGLDHVLIIPAHIPPHRSQPVTSPFHRFAMTALAVNSVDGLRASDMELLLPGPSYTADTLERLRETGARPPAQIFFITGADAFAEIDTWRRYPEVLDLAHFIVVSRPGLGVSALRQRLPNLKDRMRLPTAPLPDTPAVFLVDVATADVSSTDIRRRIAAGLAVTSLVPPAVEQHIRQHALYDRALPHSLPADHLHGQD